MKNLAQVQAITKYFPSLLPQQVQRFQQLEPLYQFWNQRINVISRKDIGNLYLHHVLHSLSIARIVSFMPGTLIMDAGTGGGFPGIPLAIYFPEVQFILTDSVAKKIHVVETIIRELNLQNCTVNICRLEDIDCQVDFVVNRAVTDIHRLFGWVQKNIRPGGTNILQNGLLALKGGDLETELGTLKKMATLFHLESLFEEPFFISKKLIHLRIPGTNRLR